MRVDVVDPAAYTPPYDHALCTALARAGADVELVTTRFAYGPVPREQGYAVSERFYRLAAGRPGSSLQRLTRLAQHVPDMLRYRRAAREPDVVHLQWLAVQPIDVHLLPRSRPLVLTAHDVLPREPRPGQVRSQGRLYERVDAVIVHSHHGRERLVVDLEIDPSKVHVVPHGAFDYLTRQESEVPLPPELQAVDSTVVLCFGLIRPYKGIEVLVDAWRGIEGAELWIVGMPRMPIDRLRAAAPPSVRFVPRFVTDPEIPAYFRRADLVVLPYLDIDQSGVLFTALAFGRPMLLSAVGGFPEVAETGAAELVTPGDRGALHIALQRLVADAPRRAQLAAAARAAAAGQYAWEGIGARTIEVYESVLPSPIAENQRP
jgi:glycosyltransferase involved in cell wall biosynthesis